MPTIPIEAEAPTLLKEIVDKSKFFNMNMVKPDDVPTSVPIGISASFRFVPSE